MPAATPPTQVMPKDYFTIGSSMNEVASIMGTPSRVDNVLDAVWWHYGYSRIVFRQGRVTEWDNTSGNLKVRWSASVAPPSPPAAAYNPIAQQISPPIARGGVRYFYSSTGEGHWIKSKNDDGDIITLEDGSIWQVDPMDRVDTALWLPITNITVIESEDGYLLINTDDGEKANAQLLHQ
jgi:hypothetical protein